MNISLASKVILAINFAVFITLSNKKIILLLFIIISVKMVIIYLLLEWKSIAGRKRSVAMKIHHPQLPS